MEAAFDTLAYTRRLKAAGFSEEQAEAQTEALHAAFREGAAARGAVATKADIETAKADLRSVGRRVGSADDQTVCTPPFSPASP